MRLRGEQGQTGAETAGVMLLVALIVGAMASSGIPATIANHTSDLICRISGGDCATPDDPPGSEQGDDEEEPAGPILTDRPLPVLPFPGSVSVKCTYSETSTTACMPPEEPGVSVQATGEVTVDRTPTSLNDEGCPQQTLSVQTTLELSANASAEGAHAGGALDVHLGESTKYGVTVSPDAAEAIEHGDRPPPNAVDPRTIGQGESVQLSQEYYAGVGMSAEYRALQASLGYDEGTRVSSGVQRVSPTTVRVMVGDEDFVRQSLSLGVGTDGAGISIGGSEELSSGKLHAVDIDISTEAGWNAYQGFLSSGTLPDQGTPGTTSPTTADTINYSDSTSLEAEIGNVTIGGQLGDSEGHRTETTNEDGTVDVVVSSRVNDVGLAVRRKEDAQGNPIGDAEYSLLLEGVDENSLGSLQQLDGDEPGDLPGGHVRIDFTESDLDSYRDIALDHLADQVERNGRRPSREEIAEALANSDSESYGYGSFEIDGVHYDFGEPYTSLAMAQTPEDTLIALYHLGMSDGSAAADALVQMLTLAGKDLPGDMRAPECG
jgi:hypothetical protein